MTSLTRKEIFSKAHEIARQTKEIAGSYKIAFSCALKDIYAGLYDTPAKTAEEKLNEWADENGIRLYEARNGETRIYINSTDQLIALTGLHYEGTDGHLYFADVENNSGSLWVSKKIMSTLSFFNAYYSVTDGCLKARNVPVKATDHDFKRIEAAIKTVLNRVAA